MAHRWLDVGPTVAKIDVWSPLAGFRFGPTLARRWLDVVGPTSGQPLIMPLVSQRRANVAFTGQNDVGPTIDSDVGPTTVCYLDSSVDAFMSHNDFSDFVPTAEKQNFPH